jgi:E3 ubiquitin-protein ligase synoviolin
MHVRALWLRPAEGLVQHQPHVLFSPIWRDADMTREFFYPTVIYLSTSKTRSVVGGRVPEDPWVSLATHSLSFHDCSVIALYNLAFVAVVFLAKAIKTLYLGNLRPNEVERVNESLRYTIPEVCIALTVFREELDARIVGLFAALLFSKYFHVLVDERMNFVRCGRA